MIRRFVVIGQRALSSADFSLLDVPGTSGRLDVLLRCVRAALLFSHGVRRDVVVYLVLLGDPAAPCTLRFDGAAAQYLRPDERSVGVIVKKALASPRGSASGFTEIRNGVSVADGGLDAAIADCPKNCAYFVLDERATDLRDVAIGMDDAAFFVGDHLGFGEATRARIESLSATPISIGPISVHAEDAIVITSNELDRRAHPTR